MFSEFWENLKYLKYNYIATVVLHNIANNNDIMALGIEEEDPNRFENLDVGAENPGIANRIRETI